MKDFDYWKKLHESETLEEFSTDEQGLLWLKLKSIVRKEFLSEFVTENKIELKETSLNGRFVELYALLSGNPANSHMLLDKYINTKNKTILAALDTKKLVSELYKLKSFDWGGDYQNSLDKYLVSRFVKVLQSYDTLVSKFETEINTAVQGYVLNSWYNHWSSILIEHLFKSHGAVLPSVGQIKHVDFFIENVPFDLKVTYLPAGYIKTRRKGLGFPVELTFLKAKAKELEIDFDKKAKHSDIYYEIVEKLKDKGTVECKTVIETLKDENLQILNEAKENPHRLAKWLYENQGEMRFGSENRLFLVLVDPDDFTGSSLNRRVLSSLLSCFFLGSDSKQVRLLLATVDQLVVQASLRGRCRKMESEWEPHTWNSRSDSQTQPEVIPQRNQLIDPSLFFITILLYWSATPPEVQTTRPMSTLCTTGRQAYGPLPPAPYQNLSPSEGSVPTL